MADNLKIADAPAIQADQVQDDLMLPTGGYGNYSITMLTIRDWLVNYKDVVNQTDLNSKADKSNTYTKSEVDTKVSSVAGGYFKAFGTLAELQAATGMTTGQVAKVMNDPTSSNNGDYYYNGTSWIKGYDSLTESKQYTDNLTVKTFDTENSTYDEIESYLDSSLKLAGDISSGGGNSLSASNYTYVLNKNVAGKTFKSIVIQSPLVGSEVTIKSFIKGSTSYTLSRTLGIFKIYKTGLNYFILPSDDLITLTSDEHIGFSTNQLNINYKLVPAAESPYYYNANSANATEIPLSNAGNTAEIQIGFFSEPKSGIVVDSVKELINDVSEIDSELFYTQIIGKDETPELGTSNAGSAQWIPSESIINSGTLSKLSIYSAVSGTIDICVYVKSGTNTFTVRDSINVNVSVGLNTFDLSIPVNTGEYLGLKTYSSGIVRYTASSDTTKTFPVYSHNDLNATTGFAGPTNGFIWQYKFETKSKVIESINNDILNLDNELSDLQERLGISDEVIGKQSVPSDAPNNANSAQWIIATPIAKNGKLKQFSTFSSVSGTLDVCVYVKSGTNDFNPRVINTVTISSGLNQFDLDIAVSAGEYLGIRANLVGMTKYLSSSDTSITFPVYSHINLTATTGFAGPTNGFQWQFNFNIESTIDLIGEKKWKDKNYTSFGDSITWYNGRTFASSHLESGQLVKGYQSYVVDELGCNLDNKGESGWTMPRIFNERINVYDFTNTYLTTITSGANDQRTGVAVGTIQPIGGTFDTTTYAGAMQAAVEKVINSNKATKIVLITPIRGWYNEYNTSNVPNTDPTTVGVLKREYPDMVKEIGKLYGLPVIDFYDNCELNDLNKNYFLGDNPAVFTAYLLHPMNRFFQRMGEIAVATLRNL